MNSNVEWSVELIDTYIEKWNWKYLSKNASFVFTEKLLEKYNDYINWGHFIEFGNSNWNKSIIDKYVEDVDIFKLCKNPFVIWDDNLFNLYILKSKAISTFCEYAKIPKNIIINYQDRWDFQIPKTGYHRRNSDGTRKYTIYYPLWHYLFKNKNTIWDDELLGACIKNMSLGEMSIPNGNLQISVNFINNNWNYSKTEDWWSTGSYEESEEIISSTYFFRDQLLNAVIHDLTFDDFVNNELKWCDILFKKRNYSNNEESYYMNNSILNVLLKERDLLLSNTSDQNLTPQNT